MAPKKIREGEVSEDFDTGDTPEIGASLEVHPLGSFESPPFDQIYHLTERLNSGTYGTVFKTSHVNNPEKYYAVKVMNRHFHKHKDENVIKEVTIMNTLREIPNIVTLVDFYTDADKMYLVQELAQGGDVFDRLVNRSKYTEKDARDLADILLTACQSLHFRRIVHRDLKPENLLLTDKLDDSTILLCDFGLATYLPKNREQGLKTRCGTPAFMAPEIVIKKPYREAIDMWSVGCLLFMLVGGYQPFQAPNDVKLFQKIRAGDFVFHEKYWGHVNLEIKQLISCLLTVNPKNRWTANQALKSAWMKNVNTDQLASSDFSSALDGIRKYNARRRLKGAMSAVRWTSSMRIWKAETSTFSRHSLNKSKSSDGTANAKAGSDKPAAAASLGNVFEEKVSFDNAYELGEVIAQSSKNAAVHKCTHKRSGETFACKVHVRTGSGARDEEIMNEVAIMQALSIYDKYIVPLVDFYEEEDRFYMVMEYEAGGDLFDRLVTKRQYQEKDARTLVRVLLKAVQYMHENGVAHRDLKPQNLLLTSSDDDSKVRLAGFRFARRVHTPQSLTQRVGTPIYVAPEVLKNIPHDERVDLWSVGVITYVLLVGYPPFLDDRQAALFQKIRTGKWSFQGNDWGEISDEAKELITGLLVVDPKERWTTGRALACRWFQNSDNAISNRDMNKAVTIARHRRSLLRDFSTTVVWKDDAKPDEAPIDAHELDNEDKNESEDADDSGCNPSSAPLEAVEE